MWNIQPNFFTVLMFHVERIPLNYLKLWIIFQKCGIFCPIFPKTVDFMWKFFQGFFQKMRVIPLQGLICALFVDKIQFYSRFGPF